MATDPITRYIPRGWEEGLATLTPNWHPEPFRALTALLMGYLLLYLAIARFESLISYILLRSFPSWAKNLCFIHNQKTTPLHSIMEYGIYMTGFCSLLVRAWPWGEWHLWEAVVVCTLGNLGAWMVLSAGLWVLEQWLRLSYAVEKATGWVCYDEPPIDIQKEMLKMPNEPKTPTMQRTDILRLRSTSNLSGSDTGSPDMKPSFQQRADEVKTRYSNASDIAVKYVRDRIRELSQMVTPQRKRQPALAPNPSLVDPNAVPHYQCITAGDENQAKSLEELRLDHYQKEEAKREDEANGKEVAKRKEMIERKDSVQDRVSGFLTRGPR